MPSQRMLSGSSTSRTAYTRGVTQLRQPLPRRVIPCNEDSICGTSDEIRQWLLAAKGAAFP